MTILACGEVSFDSFKLTATQSTTVTLYSDIASIDRIRTFLPLRISAPVVILGGWYTLSDVPFTLQYTSLFSKCWHSNVASKPGYTTFEVGLMEKPA